MSVSAMILFPKKGRCAGFRDRSAPLRPRDAQILHPIQAHNQLPTLTHKDALAFQFSQVFGNSRSRRTYQIGQILLANRDPQESTA